MPPSRFDEPPSSAKPPLTPESTPPNAVLITAASNSTSSIEGVGESVAQQTPVAADLPAEPTTLSQSDSTKRCHFSKYIHFDFTFIYTFMFFFINLSSCLFIWVLLLLVINYSLLFIYRYDLLYRDSFDGDASAAILEKVRSDSGESADRERGRDRGSESIDRDERTEHDRDYDFWEREQEREGRENRNWGPKRWIGGPQSQPRPDLFNDRDGSWPIPATGRGSGLLPFPFPERDMVDRTRFPGPPLPLLPPREWEKMMMANSIVAARHNHNLQQMMKSQQPFQPAPFAREFGRGPR
jgi:hypothetical protein